jgi:Transposase (partial DDE domain)
MSQKHYHFHIITGDETWTYYYDSETKRMSMQWTRPNQVQPTKVRRPRSVKKCRLTVFFNHTGIVSRSRLIPESGRKHFILHTQISEKSRPED